MPDFNPEKDPTKFYVDKGNTYLSKDVAQQYGANIPADPMAGRTLPGFSSPAPGTGDLKTIGDAVAKPVAPGLPAATAYSNPALIEEQKANLQKVQDAQRNQINSQYDTLDKNATELGINEQGGANNQVGRLRGEGFSSASLAYMADVQARSEKRLAQLKSDRQNALANLDMQAAQQSNDLIAKEQARQDHMSELSLQRLDVLFNQNLQTKADTRAEADQKLQLDAAKQAVLDKSIASAKEAGISEPFANQNGRFFDVRTGETFADIPSFLKAANVTSIDEAYQKGLVGNVKVQKDLTMSIQDVGGRTVAFAFDKQGNVVRKTDLGSATKSGDPNATILKSFQNKVVSIDWDKVGGSGDKREQAARQLAAEFPEIDSGDIKKKIYEVYPEQQ